MKTYVTCRDTIIYTSNVSYFFQHSFLEENRIPHDERRMRNATNSDGARLIGMQTIGMQTIGMRIIGMQTIGMRIIGMEDNWLAENWHGGQLPLIL